MNQNLGLEHLFPIARSAVDVKIVIVLINQFLTQNIDRIQSDLADELGRNIDQEFGKDCHNWQPVRLLEVVLRVVLRTSARISWGLPLCRDESYIRYLTRLIGLHAGAMIMCGQLTPWFLQPLISIFLRIPLYFVQKRGWAATTSLIKEWQAQIKQEEKEQISEKVSRVPYNLVTSFIRVSHRLRGSEELDEGHLSAFINLFVLLPFLTTVPSTCAAILDIASSPPEMGLHQQLRQEAANNLSSEKEWAAPTSFKKLRYTDSAIRETLRLTPAVLHASNREVIHPSGITLPTGQHLPRGMWVAASTFDIHTDEKFYPEGHSYKPYRFVEEQTNEDGSGLSGRDNTQDASMSKQKMHTVATTSTYLPFGSGRHACPARHFAVHFLKMIIAYIVLNYDIEHLDERPDNMILGEHILVPPSATVRVRRRKVN
ncbi:lanosterol 14-alpha demethylase [Aspergillus udagawae]|nr:lanosterol 14-alpha demethylase [Aspergillus udagawae]